MFKLPSIPMPSKEVQSLQTTVLALKEAVEIMAGVRGSSPFVMSEDTDVVNNRVADMWNRKRWDTIFDGSVSFSNTQTLTFFNLGEYERLKINLYFAPVVTSKALMRVGNGTTYISAVNNYNGAGIFNTEAAAAPSGYVTAAGSTESSIVDLCWGNNIAGGNPFGLNVTMDVLNFNKAVHTKFFMRTSFYNGSSVLQGTYTQRENTFVAARDSLYFSGYGTAGAWSGTLLIEGRKG